ncbi:MAG: PhoH family protein [Oscillospiraceae bacterium]|nr:PhoH family protein [Oscillospiraceae bacterium]
MAERNISMDTTEQLRAVFGEFDRNINLVQKAFSVTIFSRGGEVRIVGDDEAAVAKAEKAVKTLCGSYSRGETIGEQNVRYAIAMVNDGEEGEIASMSGDCVCVSCAGKPIKPKTLGQKKYCDMIRSNTITFGVGPAGTGKTYLAVALAVAAFKAHQVQRIILTRPAVEAGEKLGFLPGDLQNKVDPYLRPLYDALFEMFGQESFAKLQERGTIEVAPLAYMRGRTLDDSFIILDEAQNTTREQMKRQ